MASATVKGPVPRVVAFLAPQLGAPPCPRGLLRLPVVENGNPVSVLQIVRGADPVLGISAVGLAAPREPRAAPGPPPVAERKALFEAAPVGLGADRKSKPGGAGFEICVADGACHFRPSNFLGSFWGVSVDERQCTTANDDGKKYRQNRHNLRSWIFADVQVLTLSRRKQGFDSPRERQHFQCLTPLVCPSVPAVSRRHFARRYFAAK